MWRIVSALLFALLLTPGPADALPSFAVQTGQPCAACHVGAYGPQLTSYGRDFKLYGYVNNDTKKHTLPIAVQDTASFTHTDKDQAPGSVFPPRFSVNDNFAPAQELSVYYAGQIVPKEAGAFIQIQYSQADDTIALAALDIRRVKEVTLLGHDLVWGIDLNNTPTVQDLWNSTPAWGFPYFSSDFAPAPSATTQLEIAGQTSYGLGSYAMWDDWLYTEFTLYKQPAKSTLQLVGQPISGIDVATGVSPYWRLAAQKTFDHDHQYAEIGTYGLYTSLRPGGDDSTGREDGYTDVAFDANYQWYANPNDVRASVLSAHATYIHEEQFLGASQILIGANNRDRLDSWRADMSFSIDAAFTPTIQYFVKSGTPDASGHWGFDGASPNSAGWVGELAYVPFGKPDSYFTSLNGRVILQYTDYTKFNGTSRGASANNALALLLQFAFTFSE